MSFLSTLSLARHLMGCGSHGFEHRASLDSKGKLAGHEFGTALSWLKSRRRRFYAFRAVGVISDAQLICLRRRRQECSSCTDGAYPYRISLTIPQLLRKTQIYIQGAMDVN